MFMSSLMAGWSLRLLAGRQHCDLPRPKRPFRPNSDSDHSKQRQRHDRERGSAMRRDTVFYGQEWRSEAEIKTRGTTRAGISLHVPLGDADTRRLAHGLARTVASKPERGWSGAMTRFRTLPCELCSVQGVWAGACTRFGPRRDWTSPLAVHPTSHDAPHAMVGPTQSPRLVSPLQ